MFWDEFEKLKDVKFFDAVEDASNVMLVKYWLNYIFTDDRAYFDSLDLFKQDREFKHLLINYLALVIIACTKYHNYYIKKYSVKHFKELVRSLPNEVPVWEFIGVASKSRNNDLHLERVDLSCGVVSIYNVKATYAVELIRVKLRELVDQVRGSGFLKEVQNNEKVKNIVNYVESIVKWDNEYEGVKPFNMIGCDIDNIPNEWHPPCIRGILEDILSGGSPSHYARRSFVVYWFCAKFNPNLRAVEDGCFVDVCALDIVSEDLVEKFVDEVVELFRNVEDFDERRTRYYTCHNIGYLYSHYLVHCEYCKSWKNDGGKGLSHYCKPDEICNLREHNNYPVVIHPLDYLCYNLLKHKKR